MISELKGETVKKVCFAVVAAVFVLIAPALASALVLYDNLSQAQVGGDPLAADGSYWAAQSFGSGSNSCTLSSVGLLIKMGETGTAVARIFDDNGSQPGNPVGTMVSPAGYSTTFGENTFTASGITLLPNSTYWVVLSNDSGTFEWAYTDSTSGTGVGFRTEWRSSYDSGATWDGDAFSPYIMRVTAEPVPLPAGLLLLGPGLIGFAAIKRWLAK
jgi:hypothetical protein